MEEEKHYKENVIDGEADLNAKLMERDVLNAVGKIIEKDNEIFAILIECSYSVIRNYGTPIFGINTRINLLRNLIIPKKYY